MKKLNNKKGFTLAELLIVVAIIGVLIAIALPTFKSQLDSSHLATGTANMRSAYSEAVAADLAKGSAAQYSITIDTDKVKMSGCKAKVSGSSIVVSYGTSLTNSIAIGDGITVTLSGANVAS